MVENVQVNGGGWTLFDIAADGSLAYLKSDVGVNAHSLVWVDREGNEEAIAAEPNFYSYSRISPDGRRVALDTLGQGIWIWDFFQETLTRFTLGRVLDRNPIWTSDGERIAYRSDQSIVWETSDNAGSAELIAEGARLPSFFSAAGTELVFGESGDIGTISIGGDSEPTWLLQEGFDELNAALSSDGRWMPYQSNESGEFEIYVRPFPDVGTGREPVSNAGGTHPLWSRDGNELFYLEPGPPVRLMSVTVETEPSFSFSNREALVDWPYRPNEISTSTDRPYDVDVDGQRFIAIKPIVTDADGNAPAFQIHVVLNWFEELKERVSVP